MGADEAWTTAPELGMLAKVFEQDVFNMAKVQKGLETTQKPGATFSNYQESKIRWLHTLLGEWVNDLAKEFNASQKEYKVTPTFKGSYDESMTAAIAAFRAGNAPHILQVFEVGTATMMAAKGAVYPVYKLMADAGEPFDPKAYLPAVTGYYTDTAGNMLSFPFNASTPIQCPPPSSPRTGP